MPSNQYHGTGVNFGINSSITGVTGSFQTGDHEYTSDKDVTKDGVGNVINVNYFNFVENATFEYVAIGTGPSGTVAVQMPSVGSYATVVDSVYTQISGSTWLVDSVSSKRSNNDKVKVTVKMSRYPSVTV